MLELESFAFCFLARDGVFLAAAGGLFFVVCVAAWDAFGPFFWGAFFVGVTTAGPGDAPSFFSLPLV